MNLLCKIFGHKPPEYGRNKGWGGSEYMDIQIFTTDGIRREHAYVEGQCPRCEQTYTVGKVHVPLGVKP
jgi:hypothetical protein